MKRVTNMKRVAHDDDDSAAHGQQQQLRPTGLGSNHWKGHNTSLLVGNQKRLIDPVHFIP